MKKLIISFVFSIFFVLVYVYAFSFNPITQPKSAEAAAGCTHLQTSVQAGNAIQIQHGGFAAGENFVLFSALPLTLPEVTLDSQNFLVTQNIVIPASTAPGQYNIVIRTRYPVTATTCTNGPFTVTAAALPPGPFPFQLSVLSSAANDITFGFTPDSGVGAILIITGTTLPGGRRDVTLPNSVTQFTYTLPDGVYNAKMSAFGVDVSNTVGFSVPGGSGGGWNIDQPSVSGNSVTFTFNPASNGNVGVVVRNTSTNTVAYDSGLIPSGQSSVTWSGAITGNYEARLIFATTTLAGPVGFSVGGTYTGPGGAGCEGGFLACMTGIQSPTEEFSETGLVGAIFSSILPIVIGFGGFLTVIIIVISGIQFVTSSGNPEAAAAARGRLTFAIIGFALLVLAFAITQIIDNVFLRGSGIF